MPNPDTGDVHLNALLTDISIGYKPAGFFADRVFPVANVNKQSDIYAVYDKSYWARDMGAPGAAPTGAYAMLRAPGTPARTAGFKVDNTNTYYCRNWALGADIPDELRSNADSVFQLDADFITLLTSLLKLRMDRMFAADFMASGWGTTATGGSTSSKWSDFGASTPIEDLRTAFDTIRQGTLGMAGTMGRTRLLLGALAARRLYDHPDLIDRIKYGANSANPAIVTPNLISQVVGIDEVIEARSVYTSDEEGTAEASVTYADVVSDDALMVWAPNGPELLAPSAGYLFNWRPLAGGGLFFARKGREDRPRKDWVEVHAYIDIKRTNTAAGYFFDDYAD